jgi:O-succinylbenzoate synthase
VNATPSADGAAVPVAVELVRVRVPLRNAHRSRRSAEAVRDSVLVAWTGPDGVTGWGECPTPAAPGYATETTDEAWAALVGVLGPAALAGRPATVVGTVAAAGALADAALDARLRAAGRSLSEHLGASAAVVPRCAVLAEVGVAPAEVARRAAEAVAGGASMVKVKVAPGHDVAVVAAVRETVEVPVAADANGGDPSWWIGGRPAGALAGLDELGLAYLEQPMPAGSTWDELARGRDALRTPVALDESLRSPDAVRDAARAGALDAASVKPARLGGVERAALAVAVAAEAGIDAFVGGMFELGIGRAGAAAVAALAGCTLPTDLGPSAAYVDRDVCDPVVVGAGGGLVVPTGPGCGRSPDPARLDELAVDRVVLHR